MLTSILTLLRQHKEIILIVIVASLLRTWNLDQQMIFFGDAARDLNQAVLAVQTKQLPLLGIPSSIPRFHQGPLTIWLEMIVYVIAGHHLLAFGLFFAFLSILAVIFLYELLALFTDRKIALISAFLLAVFPLAVANGRTPYHTTPIPLFLLIYFFGLMQLWRKKSHGLFWAVLTFCLLFQFELATFPFALLIPYIYWRQHQFSRRWLAYKYVWKHRRAVVAPLAAVGIGLLPQIIYDFTHQFSHLGGFIAWVGYRLAAFAGYRNDHTFSLNRLGTTADAFFSYLRRTWAGENGLVFGLAAVTFLAGIMVVFYKWHQHKTVPFMIELTTVGTVILTLAYIIHGSPSEAYFPPFFILTAIIMGYGLSQFFKERITLISILTTVTLILYGIVNIWQIAQYQFFVNPNFRFNYGYGVAEQRQIVRLAIQRTDGRLRFRTTQPEGRFPSYFENLRWWLADQGLTEDAQGQPVFVEPLNSDFPKIVNYLMVPFPSANVYFVENLP